MILPRAIGHAFDLCQTSFVGLRALHILSLASFPIILVLYIVIAGVIGDKLPLVNGDAVAAVADVTASGVLAYGATLIGFTVSYCSLSSDYVSHQIPQEAYRTALTHDRPPRCRPTRLDDFSSP